MARDGVGRAVVYESTLSRECQRGHVYAPRIAQLFPSLPRPLDNRLFHLHLTSRLPSHPQSEIPSINFSTVRYRLIGRDCIFPLRLCGRSIRPAARSRASHLAQTTEIFTNPRQVFEFRFHKDYEKNSLCHVAY